MAKKLCGLKQKFKQWLRGTKFPFSAGWGEWDKIHADAKAAHPFRYWLAEDAWDAVAKVVTWPLETYRSCKWYLHNRLVHKTHYLPTGLNKGQWYDSDCRLLHGMFGLLVQFVEEELSQRGEWHTDEKGLSKRALAITRLNWEIEHECECDSDETECYCQCPDHQSESAKEIKELYLWWKDVRPIRVEPHTTVPDDYEPFGGSGRPYEEVYGQYDAMETRYQAEDQQNMMRLVVVSPGMWT